MRWAMFKLAPLLPVFFAAGLAIADVASPDAAQILASSDKSRGGGLPGIVWKVTVDTTRKDGDKDSMRLEVKSNGDDNLMEILAPAKARGRKILMRSNNMWFSSPNVRKPVPISPRQRLTGQASYGDVAATNYVSDYTAKMLGSESVGDTPCYVLELAATNKSVTYDKIKYWVAQESRLGLKAEFYTVSGKLIKAAEFKYDNNIDFESKTIPFISQMQIVDALTVDSVTTLTYSSIETRKLSSRDFQLN